MPRYRIIGAEGVELGFVVAKSKFDALKLAWDKFKKKIVKIKRAR
jgi:hypothetical protein